MNVKKALSPGGHLTCCGVTVKKTSRSREVGHIHTDAGLGQAGGLAGESRAEETVTGM